MSTATPLGSVTFETVHHPDGADQHVVATARGEFDLSNSSALQDDLLAALRTRPSWLALDASQVVFADSSVLVALVAVDKRARLLGSEFRLTAPASVLLKLLGLTGLEHLFTHRTRANDVNARREVPA